MRTRDPRLAAVLAVALPTALLAPACTSTGIAVREAFGYAKREQLVDRVQDARTSQGEAKTQFESALAEFLAVTNAGANAKVADLESRYDKLRKEYERSEQRAGQVRDRITAVQAVADALFAEWKTELAQYKSDALRRASERQLDDTRAQYDKLLAAMKAAEAKMTPVLAAFHDQVLFLKHNLNARAIASLQDTTAQIQGDVVALVREMEASIAEADAFIAQMRADPAAPATPAPAQ